MTDTAKRMSPNPHAKVRSLGDRDLVVWTDTSGKFQSAPPSPALLNRELYNAQLSRQGTQFVQRRNYEGYYWFSRTEQQVWYESMTEYTSLMLLDHRGGIRAIATQPMCFVFKDNTRHYPDFFAQCTDSSQVVFDVKPLELISSKEMEQFEKTRKLCEQVGWRYEVLSGLERVQRHNLEWLAAYRHSWHRPTADQRTWVLDKLKEPRTLGALFQLLDAEMPARIVHLVYRLMWDSEIGFDTSRPLERTTLLWRN